MGGRGRAFRLGQRPRSRPPQVCLLLSRSSHHVSSLGSSRSRESSHADLALPSLFRFEEVERWRRVDGASLHEVYDELYDRPASDPARVRVNLRGRADRAGHAVPVYNGDGFRVRRRIPSTFQESGALVDLQKVEALFPPDDMGRSTYHLYPLAFTRRYGNVQANAIVQPFHKVIEDVNRVLSPAIDGAPGEGGEEGDDDEHAYLFGDEVRRGAAVVRGTHAQIYNAISHRCREQARFHYVQLGLVTSAMAGTTATTVQGRRRFQRRKQHCVDGLPHERYAIAVQGDGQPQALRLEQTFTVEVSRLREEHRNGR